MKMGMSLRYRLGIILVLTFTLIWFTYLFLSDNWTYQLWPGLTSYGDSDIVYRHSVNTTDTVLYGDGIHIAIGGGIVGTGVKHLNVTTVGSRMEFFKTLLPSFCKTCSKGYNYHFYLSYDYNDRFFSAPENASTFVQKSKEVTERLCPSASNYSVHLFACNHSKKPAWAQNDAMFQAYLDGVDYFYRINDDTTMQSKGWTETFIQTLANYRPPNVGVVGPNHQRANEKMLTYDFTHRTHVNIFGWYYPRIFPVWWADLWITKIYQPARSTMLMNVTLVHTKALGHRYQIDPASRGKIWWVVGEDQHYLNRYIQYKNANNSGFIFDADGSRVIAMSLHGNSSRRLYGAIRNAQLAPVIYPGWILRFYIADPLGSSTLAVPRRILLMLGRLKAEVRVVNGRAARELPPAYWRYLVADDERVSEFLIRDAESRFTDREKAAVDEWLASAASLHVIKDHAKYGSVPIPEGLWGARKKALVAAMGSTMQKQLFKLGSKVDGFLHSVIWPSLQSSYFCHGNVTSRETKKSVAINASLGNVCKLITEKRMNRRKIPQYVGQTFDEFNDVTNDTSDQLS